MLDIFLIVSFRSRSQFTPSRVRLIPKDVQTVESDIDAPSKLLDIDTREMDKYRSTGRDKTVRARLTFELADPSKPVNYVPFVQGAAQLLETLKATRVSPAETEEDTEVIWYKPKNEKKHGDFTFSKCDSNQVGTFLEKCRLTLSQLQFWLVKGLEVIEAKDAVDTPEASLISKLVQMLVFYLRPMMLLVVKPILESEDEVQNLRIALECPGRIATMEIAGKHSIELSLMNQLGDLMKVDWAELLSVLYESNQELIDKQFLVQLNQLPQITDTSYRFVICSDELLRFQESSITRRKPESPPVYENPAKLPPEGVLYSTRQQKDFNIGFFDSAIVFSSRQSVNNPNPQTTNCLVVKINLCSYKIWCCSNDNLVVIIPSDDSIIMFAATSTILRKLNLARMKSRATVTAEFTKVFQTYHLQEKPTYWHLLGPGLLQICSVNCTTKVSQIQNKHFHHSLDSKHSDFKTVNDSRYMMIYTILLDSRGKPGVSKFDLTNLFRKSAFPDDGDELSDISFISQGGSRFFVSFLQVGDMDDDKHLCLTRFSMCENRLVLLNDSTFKVTWADLATLDNQFRVTYGNGGNLQWLVKQDKYFSLAFLTSQKYCILVHVFHNSRFLPIGGRKNQISGITQLGMGLGIVLIADQNGIFSTAISETKDLLRRNKREYRLFALTPAW